MLQKLVPISTCAASPHSLHAQNQIDMNYLQYRATVLWLVILLYGFMSFFDLSIGYSSCRTDTRHVFVMDAI